MQIEDNVKRTEALCSAPVSLLWDTLVSGMLLASGMLACSLAAVGADLAAVPLDPVTGTVNTTGQHQCLKTSVWKQGRHA